MENNVKFSYNYSAAESEEVAEIRKKYLPKDENKLETLKALDRKVSTAGTLESLIVGIIGCLVFGLGMCMGLNAIAGGMVFGIILGVIGVIIMLPAYPVYLHMQRKARTQLTPKILELASELSGEK